MEPKINPKFWLDEDLVEQPPEIRFAVLWMIASPGTDLLGVFTVSPKTFAFQTGLEPAWLEKALAAMKGKIVREGNKVWLRKYVAYQIGKGQKLSKNLNMLKALSKPFGMASQGIQDAFLREYPETIGSLGAGGGLGQGLEYAPGLGAPVINSGNEKGEAKGVGEPKNRTDHHRTEQQSGGAGESEAGVPTIDEVLTWAQMAAGVDPEYARYWYSLKCEQHTWLVMNRLVDWRRELKRKWETNRGWFEKKQAEKRGAGGTAPSQEELEGIDAELQWQQDPARIEGLKKRRKELAPK